MAAANSNDPESVLLQRGEGSPSPPSSFSASAFLQRDDGAPSAGRLRLKACVAVGLCASAAGLVGAVTLGRSTTRSWGWSRDPDPCSAIDPWSTIDLHKLQECKSFLRALEKKKAEEQGWPHHVDSLSGETLDCKKSEQACTVQYEMYGMSIGQAKCFPAVCKQAVEGNIAVCKEAVEAKIFKEVEANMAGMPAEAQLSSIDVSCAPLDTAKEADAEADADAVGEDVSRDVSCMPVTISLIRELSPHPPSPPNFSNIAQSEQHSHDPCNGVSKLPTALRLEKGVGFERVNLCRCALVGSSSNLLGSKAGDLINSYDTVIRVNRVPKGFIQRDLGNKTDVLVLNTHQSPMEPMVSLMQRGGNEFEPPRVTCSSLDNCRSTAIVWRADEQSGVTKYGLCRPHVLADAWGRGHPFVACVRHNVSGISWGFKKVHKHVPSTGFVAFVTFLTLCKELDLFGFGGNATADGHIEDIEKHNLAAEHYIQDAFAARRHRPAWTNFKQMHVDPDALDWIWHHGAKVRKVNVSV